jgi:hypothetical protein
MCERPVTPIPAEVKIGLFVFLSGRVSFWPWLELPWDKDGQRKSPPVEAAPPEAQAACRSLYDVERNCHDAAL